MLSNGPLPLLEAAVGAIEEEIERDPNINKLFKTMDDMYNKLDFEHQEMMVKVNRLEDQMKLR